MALLLNQIIDFTHLVLENENWICFNPCITKYKDNLYLCCFRKMTRGYHKEDPSLTRELNELFKNVYGNPNHPWRARWGNQPKEPAIKSREYTKFFMLQINQVNGTNFDIKIVKEYNEVFNDNLSKFTNNVIVDNYIYEPNRDVDLSVIFMNFQTMWDVRIHQSHVTDLFFITGNFWHISPDRRYRIDQDTLDPNSNENCNNGCTAIGIYAIRIDPITLKMRYLTDRITLCPALSNRTEKNWSLFIRREEIEDNIQNNNPIIPIKITYQLTQGEFGHEIMYIDFNIQTNAFSQCYSMFDVNNVFVINPVLGQKYIQYPPKHLKAISLYKMFEDAFKSSDNRKILSISSTTPTIRLNNQEFLSVGHIKFEYNVILNDAKFNDKPIKTFVEYCRQNIVNFHYQYIYLLFFYTFDQDDFSIKRISGFYLPQPADASLVFPMGLTEINNNFILSYGNYDTTCEAMFFNREILDNILFNIDGIPFIQGIDLDNNGNITNINVVNNNIVNGEWFFYTGWNNNVINKIILK